jgi:hypothetical protein
MAKKYYTIGIRYESDRGDACDPPPHIMEKIATCLQTLHEKGWAMEVVYGRAEKNLIDGIDTAWEE